MGIKGKAEMVAELIELHSEKGKFQKRINTELK